MVTIDPCHRKGEGDMARTCFFLFLVLVFYGCSGKDIWQRVNDSDVYVAPITVNVLDVVPAPGASGVPVNTTISAAFDDNIDLGTINTGTFSVNSASIPVNGTFVYDQLGRIVTFTPSTLLATDTLYTVELTTDITNNAGERLTSLYTWSFNTASPNTSALSLKQVEYGMPLVNNDTFNYGGLLGGQSRTYSFEIKNIGTADLSVYSINIAGTDAGLFSLNSPSLNPVVPGGTLSFSIAFQPVTGFPGLKSASFSIQSSDSDNTPLTVTVTGECQAVAAPDINAYTGTLMLPTGTQYSFGTVVAGEILTVPFTIENIGSTDLVLGTPVLGGRDPEMFGIDDSSMSATVTPGSSTTLYLSYEPTATGIFKADVSIPSNDPDEPTYMIRLMGRTK